MLKGLRVPAWLNGKAATGRNERGVSLAVNLWDSCKQYNILLCIKFAELVSRIVVPHTLLLGILLFFQSYCAVYLVD